MFRKCVSMAALCLTLALAGSVNAELGQGKVLFEFWDNIGGGTNVDNDLRTNANFPDNPSSSMWADNFQSPAGRRQLRRSGPRVHYPARNGRIHLLGRRR